MTSEFSMQIPSDARSSLSETIYEAVEEGGPAGFENGILELIELSGNDACLATNWDGIREVTNIYHHLDQRWAKSAAIAKLRRQATAFSALVSRIGQHNNTEMRAAFTSLSKGALGGVDLFLISSLPVFAGSVHTYVFANYIKSYLSVADPDRLAIVVTLERNLLQRNQEHYRRALVDRLAEHAVPISFLQNGLTILNPDNEGFFARADQVIGGHCPRVIFSWGGIFESVLVRRMAYWHRPVVFMPFNRNNAVDEMIDVYADYGYHQREIEGIRVGRQVVPNLVLPARSARSGWRPPPKRLRVLTAVSGQRIPNLLKRYSDKQYTDIRDFFARNPSVRWTLLGVTEPESVARINEVFRVLIDAGRLDVRRTVANFDEVLGEHDVYAHLPQLGGGGNAIVTAAMLGLVPIVHASCDGAAYMPDGAVVQTWRSFWEKLDEALTDHRFGSRLVEDARSKLKHLANPEDRGRELLTLADLAIEQAKSRLKLSG